MLRTTLPPTLDAKSHVSTATPRVLNPAQRALRAYLEMPNEQQRNVLVREAKTWNPLGSGKWEDGQKAAWEKLLGGVEHRDERFSLQDMRDCGISFGVKQFTASGMDTRAVFDRPLADMPKEQRDAVLDVLSPKGTFAAAIVGGVPDSVPFFGRGSR